MMKPLNNLTSIEKAQMLHQLFPDEIPAFLTFIHNMSVTIKEEEDQHRKLWDNGLFDFDFWLGLVNEADKKINQYGDKLIMDYRLFADQLFDGYPAVYLVHCLMVYTTQREHPNEKFTQAVDLLFNP